MKEQTYNEQVFLKMQMKQQERSERFIIYLVVMETQAVQKEDYLVMCMSVWQI